MDTWKRSFLIGLIFFVCSACSAGRPRLISAARRLTPIAKYPGNSLIIYQAYIELQVDDVDAAATQAEILSLRYGGRLSGTQYWYVDGRKVSTLQLTVPSGNFDRLRLALLDLGVMINESITSQVDRSHTSITEANSAVTLMLRPTDTTWKLPAENRWDPRVTFRRAFDVFLAIFSFLADVVIWILVVAGPFALVWLLAWRLSRLWRRRV